VDVEGLNFGGHRILESQCRHKRGAM
jgi:hypothetical protein